MADTNNDEPVELEAEEARGGETLGVMRYVLGFSLVLVIVVFVAIYYTH